jgi:hypothetical protein
MVTLLTSNHHHIRIGNIVNMHTFPDEILRKITDIVCKSADSIKTLKACASTCYAWAEAAQPLIFRNARITNDRQCSVLCDAVLANPRVAGWILSLEFLSSKGYESFSGLDAQILTTNKMKQACQMMNFVQKLTFSSIIFQSIAPRGFGLLLDTFTSLGSVTELRLNHVCFGSSGQALAFMRLFPSLSSLVMSNPMVEILSHESIALPSNAFPFLETLILENVEIGTVYTVTLQYLLQYIVPQLVRPLHLTIKNEWDTRPCQQILDLVALHLVGCTMTSNAHGELLTLGSLSMLEHLEFVVRDSSVPFVVETLSTIASQGKLCSLTLRISDATWECLPINEEEIAGESWEGLDHAISRLSNRTKGMFNLHLHVAGDINPYSEGTTPCTVAHLKTLLPLTSTCPRSRITCSSGPVSE